jgi:hypothetical protein
VNRKRRKKGTTEDPYLAAVRPLKILHLLSGPTFSTKSHEN